MIINITCIIITLIVIILAIVICSRRKTKDIHIENENQLLLKQKLLLEDELAELNINRSTILTDIANNKNDYNKCSSQLNELKENLNKVQNDYNNIKYEKEKEQIQYDNIIAQEKQAQNRITKINENAGAAYDTQKQLAGKAFENYCDTLSKAYEEKELEHDILLEGLNNAYSKQQSKLMAEADALREEIQSIQEELETIRRNRAAAAEAIQRERTVRDNLSSYCIPVSDVDKADIKRLEDVAITLSKPRVLYMLVWQTFFQKPLKTLSASLLGTDTVCGIYKITNIETNECYIGQAVNIADRWTQHVKCGLHIDTPPANKLYNAMAEYHMWNFSFELLEECEPRQLNEREAYYIDMYNSYNFGYNSNQGVRKS